MTTRVVRLDPLKPDRSVLEEAAEVLRKGGLVAFPTETVYGLGADAFSRTAVLRVYEVKRRPLDNPVIVHVSRLEMLGDVAEDVPQYVLRALERSWPGPLTVVVRRRPSLPKEVSGGLDTVAVRMPGHPVALGLIEALGKPIAAPSANLSGRPSPTRAEHVVEDLWGSVEMILDAGPTFFGVESTVVDVTRDPPLLLRPGPIGVEELEKVLGKGVDVPDWARGLEGPPERAPSPGVRYRHYAPRTTLVLVELRPDGLQGLVRRVMNVVREELKKGRRVAVIASRETAEAYKSLGIKVVVLGARENLFEVARNLFEVLRLIDGLEVDVAIAEGFEEISIGLAIMNRLRKASSVIV